MLDDIYVAGYPFGKAVSSSVKVTKGVVSALTGSNDNYALVQIDAAIQPGNSGGPIVDEESGKLCLNLWTIDTFYKFLSCLAIPDSELLA